jgi:adenylate cyclase
MDDPMTTEDFKRKLTAILSADVVGYSRLMGEDEEATVLTLNKYKEMIFGLIERHNGRLVDSPGDNVLAEFASVVDAVRCGVQIQEDLKASNEELPPDRKMEFRIGINTGDVIQDGDRIYGDGVNVAARIESLADPGGICISRTAYDQVKNKINIDYEYLGDYEVKNISEPVQVYRIRMEPEAVTPKAPNAKDVEEAPKTIAILPFINMSSDPEQEYFADGLSEELINSITKIPDLLVTARTSSFSFKGTNKKVQEIAKELGVAHILEGSVRKAGNALRITAQLIRATDGFHLWSEKYDRELKDIFAVQENIATAVADELKITLGIDKSLKQLGGTDNVKAYEFYLVAQGLWNKVVGEEKLYSTIKKALESIDGAIAIDPEFALAWARKATIHTYLTVFGPTGSAEAEREAGLSAALRSIELEPNLAAGYFSLGFIKANKGDWIDAESEFRKALQLKREPLTGADFSIVIYYDTIGYFKRGRELIEEILRNDPLNMEMRGHYLLVLYILDDMGRAEEEYKRAKELFGDQWWIFGDMTMTLLRLDSNDVVSRDYILYSDQIFDVAKKHLDSPKVALTELHLLYTDSENQSTFRLVEISCLAAYFGDPEFALEAMEKAINVDRASGFHLWWPILREVRQLPRFKKLVKEIGLVDYWNRFGWPDICRPLDNGDFECD